MEESVKATSVFGVDIAVGTREELFDMCSSLIGKGGVISTVNPEILYSSIKNSELRLALVESLCIPDGFGVEFLLKKKGVVCERFAGVELGEALLEKRVVRLGIIGGRENVAKAALENLVLKHRNVIPEFALSGYNIDILAFKKRLSETKPDILFVCLGSPKQELFIREIKDASKRTLFISLGGSADVYSGNKKRAPKIIRTINCEWIYRILREPKRIKRLPKLFGFIYLAIKSEKNG